MTQPRKRGGEEAGETLVEVLFATALLAILVVGIIGGLSATVLGSHVHRGQADANTVLLSAIEGIKSPAFDFSNVDCGKTTAERTAAYETEARKVAMPSGWPATSLTVSGISFEAPVTAAGVTFGSTCTPGLRRQLVTLLLTSPDGRVAPTLSFVKGDI